MRNAIVSSLCLAALAAGLFAAPNVGAAFPDDALRMAIPDDEVFELRPVTRVQSDDGNAVAYAPVSPSAAESDGDDLYGLYYIWPDDAVMYEVTCESGKVYDPGRPLFTLKIKHSNDDVSSRSKAHLKAGLSMQVVDVLATLGQHVERGQEEPLLILSPKPVHHDSVAGTGNSDSGMDIGDTFISLVKSTGAYDLVVRTGDDWTLGLGRVLMILVGLALLYLAIAKGFEPLLLVPIGFGAIMTNIPLANLSGPDGVLGILYNNFVANGLAPLLIFMGVGAMTDFGPLIANPKTAFLGAAAQAGIFLALLGALLLEPVCGFSLKDAAAIGIIGGADGPTAIFLGSRLSPKLLGAIAVAAYSYMALVPIIQPPIMKALTTPAERKIRMSQLRHVNKLEKIIFPISITLLCALLLPDAASLISMLMFGNLMKECGVVNRLADTTQNALINIVTIALGLSVGSKLSADQFLNIQTLGILLLGLVAFCIGTATGVLLGKLMSKLSGGKINPLIGAAGVSAVPMAARVVNKVGMEEDHHNFLLMHAMGPNVAGVIGSAVAAGILLNALQMLT